MAQARNSVLPGAVAFSAEAYAGATLLSNLHLRMPLRRKPQRLAHLAANPAVAVPLATLLARRLQNVTNYLVDLKQQFRDQDGHLGMVDEVLESLANEQGERFIPAEDLPPEP